MLRVGFDVGGTFTDVAVVDDRSGESWLGKTLTTHHDVADAIGEGIRTVLVEAGRAASDVTAPVIGATTLVTNALIERRGGPTALITTRGFSDLIEIGRETRYDLYNARLEFPEPYVPRELRFEVKERVRADAAVDAPLDLDELTQIVARLRASEVRSVAICFLNSYANSIHEEMAEAFIVKAAPDLDVTASFRVAPEIREVERVNTAIADAYVRPVAGSHLAGIETRLTALGVAQPLHLMQSNGGLVDSARAARQPIHLLESGPAAGVLGAAHWSEVLGIGRMMSFDMGGTTAKICLIDDYEPSLSRSFEVARVQRFKAGSGVTVRIPVIDLLEIGAGGGSIAHIDEMGLLKVGPTSAGSEPGPACYGLGGRAATITDADLVLGYLDSEHFLGGRMALDAIAAAAAIRHNVAESLDVSVIDAASGIVRIVNESMGLAARVHATEQGRDPRDYVLFAFGGAGPLHACALARALGIAEVVVPAAAGALSATGLHIAVPSVRLVQTHLMRTDAWDDTRIGEIYASLICRAEQALEAFSERGLYYERTADIRFRGQGFELEVPLPETFTRSDVIDRFIQKYRSRYGSVPTFTEPEVVSWRLAAYARVGQRTPFAARVVTKRKVAPSPGSKRPIWDPQLGWLDAQVFEFDALAAGDVLDGPAIVHQAESTIAIGSADVALVDEYRNCRITIGKERTSA